jgi:hypothetical protein
VLFWLALLFLPGVAAAQVGAPITSGSTVTIDAHGVCRDVTNPGSGTRMVFTETAAEWQSFIDNPEGLNFAACSGGGTWEVEGLQMMSSGECFYGTCSCPSPHYPSTPEEWADCTIGHCFRDYGEIEYIYYRCQ